MRHFLIVGLFMLIGFSGFLLYHLGALKPVQIEVILMPETRILAKKHVGPYHTTVQTLEVVEKWMLDQGLPCRESFGLYLDDPAKVEAERLQSFGGCILRDNLNLSTLPENFKVLSLPEQEVIAAYFDGSPGIGPMKVYPRAEEMRVQMNRPKEKATLEVYEIIDRNKPDSMKTKYYFLQKLMN